MKIPQFKTKEELFDHLWANKDDYEYEKKSALKTKDCIIPMHSIIKEPNTVIDKSESTQDPEVIKVRAIINTTNVMDSHKDVHIPGLWKKSLSENKRIKHLQEHRMAFDKIISDKSDLKAYTKDYSWEDLGIDAKGTTEALVFDSNVRKSRNEFMYKQYKDGNVDNHSVGMFYVKLKLAMNSEKEEHKEAKAEYDKHIDNILNKAEVEKNGYFWAIYEAKVIEGSAVPLGSNSITPTLSRSKDTQEEMKEEADKSLSPYLEFLKS